MTDRLDAPNQQVVRPDGSGPGLTEPPAEPKPEPAPQPRPAAQQPAHPHRK